MKKVMFLLFIIQYSSLIINAQNRIIDSLQTLIKNDKEDTVKVNHLITLSQKQRAEGLCSEAIKTGKEALSISEKINYKKGIADAYTYIAEAHYWKSDFISAIDNHSKALKLYSELADELNISIVLNDLGNDYFWKGDYPTALNYFLKALKVAEKLNTKISLMSIYISIGQANEAQHKDTTALEYYFKALKVSNELMDKRGIQAASGNIGTIYYKWGNNDKAIDFFNTAMNLSYELNLKYGIQSSAMRLGNIYLNKKEYEKALDYFMKMLEIARKSDEKDGMSVALEEIGNIYVHQNKFKEAEHYLLHSKAVADSIGALVRKRDVANSLSQLYEKINRSDKALEFFKLYKATNDSIYNAENSRQMGDLKTNFAVEKKETELKAEHEKKDIIAAHEINHQKNVRNYSLAGLAALLLFSILLYNRFQLKQKALFQKELIKQQELRSKAVIDAEEKERMRIAQELHDGLGQQLSAVKLNMSSLESSLELKNNEQKVMMQNALEIIDESVKEVRAVSHNMMPNALLKSGLGIAVREFLNRISHTDKLKIELEITGLKERLESTTETILFRVLQEIVNNIIKHSEATIVNIQIVRHDKELTMMVEDNGIGFDISKIKSDGIGLKNIQSRIEYLNGTVHYDSQPQKGTTVIIEVPIK